MSGHGKNEIYIQNSDNVSDIEVQAAYCYSGIYTPRPSAFFGLEVIILEILS